MRAGGVPARVVTGYQGGEWNPIGGYLLIRRSDAHAWVEVWEDSGGWVRVDPTAVVAPERLRRGILDMLPGAGSAPRARLLRDFSYGWCSEATRPGMPSMPGGARRSSHTTTTSQLRLLESLGFGNPGWQQLGWLLAGALTLWLLLISWRFGRAGPARGPDRLARAYLRLCARLARYGPPRQPHQGPLAYAAALDGRSNWRPGRAGPRTAASVCPIALRQQPRDRCAAARVRTAHQSLAGATSACSRVCRNVMPGQRSSVRCRFTREGARYTSAAP